MIGTIRRIAYATATQHLSRLSVVEGRLKGTDVPFRCLFVSTSDFTESLKKRLYEEPPAVVASSRIWLRQARKRIEERLGSVDLCVAVLPKGLQPAFEGFYDFRTTEVVRQVIDTSGTWDEIRGRFSNNKRRIANKFADRYGLAYRISNDLADFDLFYHRMFVPHIRKRFGDLADIESYEDMRSTSTGATSSSSRRATRRWPAPSRSWRTGQSCSGAPGSSTATSPTSRAAPRPRSTTSSSSTRATTTSRRSTRC